MAMKSINWHGDILTEKHYIIPEPNSLNMPVIKVPCALENVDEIDLTFPTELDAKVYDAGCPRCGDQCLMSSIGPDGNYCVSHWMCHICYWRWSTDRGITIKPAPVQMLLFEAVQ